MSENAAVRLAEISVSPGPLPERARALLDELNRHIPFDASWIALTEPDGVSYTSLASTDLDRSTLQYLSGPRMARDIELTGADRVQAPLSTSDLPYPCDELQTWAECLLPAGFHEALSVALYESGGRHVGFMTVLFRQASAPSAGIRRLLTRVLPIVASGIDPVVSITASALLVGRADAGAVLLPGGGVGRLPGLPDDGLFAAGSELTALARGAIGDGQVHTTFLWPRRGRGAPDGHVQVTVIGSDRRLGAVLTGIVLLSPPQNVRGLTPRELEVLGFLIEGCSNHDIARALVVAPRTVAAHLEHILCKLEASSRTLAAVRAERAGLYIPPPRAAPE